DRPRQRCCRGTLEALPRSQVLQTPPAVLASASFLLLLVSTARIQRPMIHMGDSWRESSRSELLAVCAEEPTASVEHAYWMTWSARSSSDCGIVRPSASAVLRLMTNSNFVGCSTGRSAGLAPLRILSTKSAVRRNRSGRYGP